MSKVFLFAEFRLDCKNWTLYRDDDVVDLQPKVIDTLIYLIEHAGEVVSYEELTAHLWSGVVVEPGSLRRNISILRNTLDAKQPYRFVQTIKNRGLCFIAPVTMNDAEKIFPGDTDAIVESTLPDISRIRYRWRPTLILSVALAGVLLVALGIHATLKKPGHVLKQLTSNSEEFSLIAASLSPNGNMIASTDGAQLFISDTKAIEWHSLPMPGVKGSLINDLEWFPDGVHLLICSNAPGSKKPDAWSVSVLSGKATFIAGDAASAAASPDGRQVVFMRNDNKQLWTIDTTSNKAQLVYSDPHVGEMTGPAFFSVNGRYVLLMHSDLHHSTITAHDAITRQSHTVFESDTELGGFIPLATGEILFTQYMSAALRGDQLLISKVNLDSGVYEKPELLQNFPNDVIRSLSVNRNGRKILITKSLIQSDIYVASLTNHGSSMADQRRLTGSDTDERPADWLDNDTILMTSDRSGAFNVFTQRLDSSSVIALTTGARDHLRAALSADRNWLFYVIDTGAESQHHMVLYRRSLRDGSEQAMYSSNDPSLLIHCAYFSNRCVIAEHDEDECVFYEFDPLQGRGKPLAHLIWRTGLSVHNWDLSRDGRNIALLNNENGVDTISILDLDHSPVHYGTLKIESSSPAHTLTWDAESSGFYVTAYTDEDNLFNLFHVGLDGTMTVLRSEKSSQDGWAIASPDGKHLAYQKYESVGNMWLFDRQ